MLAHCIPAQFPAYKTIGVNATAIIMPLNEIRSRGHRMEALSGSKVDTATGCPTILPENLTPHDHAVFFD
jgi:hypothetical protein